jgi:NAD(P)H-dependent FMN reductase
MKTLLIVYHSQSGAAATLARALWRGAQREAAVQSRVRRACDAGIDCVAAADGLALVAAENSGSAAGGIKECLDRVFYPAIDRGLVLPYALVISAGNDGRGAQRQLERILSGIPLRRAVETRIVRGEPMAADLEVCAELGQGLAAGLEMGIF